MSPHTSRHHPGSFVSFAVAATVFGACSGGGGGAPNTGGGTPTAAAHVVGKATFTDVDRNRQVGSGDTLTVRFDRPVQVRRSQPVPFVPRVAGDGFGSGARIEAGSRADEVRLVLGAGAVLRTAGPAGVFAVGASSSVSLPVTDAIVDAATAAPIEDPTTIDVAAGFVLVALGANDGQQLASGDLDGDGDLDLVVGRDEAPAQVLWNDGAAAFTGGPLLGEGRALAVGDVDGDGDLDVVVGSDDVATTVWRNAAGVFSATQSLPFERTVAVGLGDLDGDGDVDLVRGNGPADDDAVWWNDGGGTFTRGTELGGGNTHCVTLADVDRDGDLDLLQGRSGPNRIWRNDGAGGFGAGQALGSGNTHAIACADVDCDGDVDLLTAGRDPSEVWRNDGTGVFASTGQLANAATDAVCWVDYDGDGRLDVYAANANGQDDELWYLDAAQVLRHAGTSIVNGTTNDAEVGDFDGDGDADVITIGGGAMQLLASSLSATVGTPTFSAGNAYVGQGAALDLVLADFDRDGDFDLIETMGTVRDTVLWRADGAGAWTQWAGLGSGATHATAGDVDRDGDVDLVLTGPTAGLQLWTNATTGPAPVGVQLSLQGGNGVLLVDLDRDGDRDLVQTRGSAGAATLWRNDGSGGFTAVAAPGLPNEANGVVAVDLDRDGDQDLLFATTNGLVVAANAGDGTFPTGLAVGTAALDVVAVGDVDRDGDADVVVGGAGGHAIWQNDGGALPNPVALAGPAARALAVVDLDGDGDLDVLSGGPGADAFWRNDAGVFTAVPVALSAGPTNDLVVLDLGCDGDLDVVVADGSAAGGFRVFLRN